MNTLYDREIKLLSYTKQEYFDLKDKASSIDFIPYCRTDAFEQIPKL